MPFKPSDFPTFSQPDYNTVELLMEKFPRYLHNIASVLQINNPNEILVSQDTVYEIITRVEQRRVYFHIFHNELDMGELNEGALICFWILKLMPFKHNDISNSLLNAKIALTFMINILYYVAEKSKPKRKVNIKGVNITNLLYTFQYRDLSKEAIMALAESLLV